MRLKARFFASHGAAVACGTLMCLGALYAGSRLLLAREMEQRMEQQLANFAVAAREAALNNEELGLLSFMRRALEDSSLAAAVYEVPSDGLRLALPPAVSGDAALKALPQGGGAFSLADGREAEARVAEFSAGARRGRVLLAYLPGVVAAEQADRLRPWLLLGGASALASLLLGGLLSLWLARQMAGPLNRLRRGTRLVREGKLDRIVEISRDDELGELARDFNAMTAQLAELDELKRDFVAGVTHDLGTPLQAMRSSLRLLQDGKSGSVNAVQSELLLGASNAAENLTAFIQNLLTVANIEAGKVAPYFEDFDPALELSQLEALYRPQARELGLDLSLALEHGGVLLRADRTQFRQMALNLLSNALKYTEAGWVRMRLRQQRGQFLLSVADSGPGIDAKYHELIFDKFFRVQPTAGAPRRQGSGLGLSIARGLARAHGGDVGVESAPGQGSCFTLRLPPKPEAPT